MKIRLFILAPLVLLGLGIIAVIIGFILTLTIVFSMVGIPLLIIGIIMIIASLLLAAKLIIGTLRHFYSKLMSKITGRDYMDNQFAHHKHANQNRQRKEKKKSAESIDVDEKSTIIDVEEEEKGIFKVK